MAVATLAQLKAYGFCAPAALVNATDKPIGIPTAYAIPAILDHAEAQAYIDDMARKRGYVLDYHKVMAKHDFPVLQATNGIVSAASSANAGVGCGNREMRSGVTW